MGQCKCCGRNEELRMGFCFDCAGAESVIANGTDMWDNEPPRIEGMSTHMSKLQFILKNYINIPSELQNPANGGR